MNKRFLGFTSFVGIYFSLFVFVGIAHAFNGPTGTPGSSAGVIQFSTSPSAPPPASLIIGSSGAITFGKWETTDTGLPVGTGSPPAVATYIGTLYGGTGCSAANTTVLRDCIDAAESGANSDITSLAPSTGVLNINPTSYVGISLNGATPPATTPPAPPVRFAIGEISGSVPFVINDDGDITRIKNVTYSWPSTQGAAGTILTAGASGALSWAAAPANSGGWTEDTSGAGKIYTTTLTRNVGIGTASPGSTLTIKTTSGVTPFIIKNASNSNVFEVSEAGVVTTGDIPWGRLTGFPSACVGQFATALTTTSLNCTTYTSGTGGWTEDDPGNKITTTTPGRNVGIGTASPSAKLHVAGDAIITGTVAINTPTVPSSTTLVVNGIIESTSGGFKFPDGITQSAASLLTGSGSANYIPKWSASTGLANSLIYQNPSTSNLGIGTTNPSARFHVEGGGVLVNSNSAQVTPTGTNWAIFASSGSSGATTAPGNGVITANLYSGGASSSAIYANIDSLSTAAGIEINQAGSGDIARFVKGANSVVISSAGNLGIGTTTPAAKLEIVSTTEDALRLKKNASAGSVNLFTAIGDGTSRTGTALCNTLDATSICLGHWNSGGTTQLGCSTTTTSGRALCTSFGD